MSSPSCVIDGRSISQKIQSDLSREIHNLKEAGIEPRLAVIWLGDDPASGFYFRAKEKLAGALGIGFEGHHLPGDASHKNLIDLINNLNEDKNIHGVLIEAPLPRQIDLREIQQTLASEKDVDGITLINQGKLFSGQEAFLPATPYGVLMLLKACGVELAGKHAVVIGRSEVVGKPLAILLLRANATVTICHSKTRALKDHTLQADIICAAAGVAQLIKADMIKPGAVVIDIGYNAMPDGSVVGDVDFESVKEKAGLITPVKGGVGALTATMIMANTIMAARLFHLRKRGPSS